MPRTNKEKNELLVNAWIEEMDPVNLNYEVLIACTTAKLLDNEPTPAFLKNIDRWTKVLIEHGKKTMVLESEMELLLALETEDVNYWFSEIEADVVFNMMKLLRG